MKKIFLFMIFVSTFIFASGCTFNKMAARIVDNWEADTLKKLENPEPGEEAKLRAHLADIYNAKAQFLMVNEPDKLDEAMNWFQQSIEQCNLVIQEWPNDYANDKTVRTKVNLTMANNMFLMGNQEEANQWCSLLQDIECPQVLKELR